MRSNEEIKKTFKIFKDEKGLINLSVFSALNEPEDNTHRAKLIDQEFDNIFKEDENKIFKLLIDLTAMKEMSKLTGESNKIYRKIAKNKQLEVVAILGDPALQSKIVSFVLPFAKIFSGKVSWFQEKEEALMWLNI